MFWLFGTVKVASENKESLLEAGLGTGGRGGELRLPAVDRDGEAVGLTEFC